MVITERSGEKTHIIQFQLHFNKSIEFSDNNSFCEKSHYNSHSETAVKATENIKH